MSDTDHGTVPGAPGRDDFDPLSPEVLADPHAMYRDLRARCPVAHSRSFGGFWALTRYEDVEWAVTNPQLFTSRFGIVVPRNPASGRRPPLHHDPPEHTTYRRAMNPVFRKDRLARLEPVMAATVAELVADAVLAGRACGFDDLASPLAARTLSALLNVPAELSADVSRHAAAFERAQFAFDAAQVEEENRVLYDLARRIVIERRRRPLDPAEDLVSALFDLEVGGERIDDEVVAGSLRQVLVAGHGAPALVMANGLVHLARDRALQDRLRADVSLVPAAVEELLRLHTPNQGFARTVVAEVEVGGETLAPGELVTVSYTAANRDPAVFDDPDELRLGRGGHHLAFGHGTHVCPGSHPGRRQMQLLIERVLAATSSFELTGDLEWAPFPVHGPTRAPLALHTAS
ncbi:MAG: cytochrome P450 [Actinomycetota bacterium]|nr:cytochrome P450 [Actinomycetota bacterium]